MRALLRLVNVADKEYKLSINHTLTLELKRSNTLKTQEVKWTGSTWRVGR